MDDEKFRKRIKKFDDWYKQRISDAEERLAKLKQQYELRRRKIVRDYHEQR